MWENFDYSPLKIHSLCSLFQEYFNYSTISIRYLYYFFQEYFECLTISIHSLYSFCQEYFDYSIRLYCVLFTKIFRFSIIKLSNCFNEFSITIQEWYPGKPLGGKVLRIQEKYRESRKSIENPGKILRIREKYWESRKCTKEPGKVLRIQKRYLGSRKRIKDPGKVSRKEELQQCRNWGQWSSWDVAGGRGRIRESQQCTFFYIMLKVFSYEVRNILLCWIKCFYMTIKIFS